MLEREYNVPLRREFLKSPKYKRTNRAVSALRTFISKHMKSTDVSIGKHLNNKMWANGIRNPPHKVTVKAIKDDSGKVTVELKDLPNVKVRTNKRLSRVEKSEGESSDKEESPKETKKSEDTSEKKSSKSTESKRDVAPAKPSEESKDKKSEDKASEKKSESKSEDAPKDSKKTKSSETGSAASNN